MIFVLVFVVGYLLDHFSRPLDHDGLGFFDRRGHLVVVAQQTQDRVLVPVPARGEDNRSQEGRSTFTDVHR